MAIATTKDFASHDIKFGPKTAFTALYILIGLIAMGIAVPAALATGAKAPGVFDECYSSCAGVAQ